VDKKLTAMTVPILPALSAAMVVVGLWVAARAPAAQAAASFTDMGALGLPAVSDGAVQWGDYDSDGDLDVAIAGHTAAGAPIARLCRNNGGGAFSDASAGFEGMSSGAAAWGDYDNDGDLDLLVAGNTAGTRLYRNEGTDTFVRYCW